MPDLTTPRNANVVTVLRIGAVLVVTLFGVSVFYENADAPPYPKLPETQACPFTPEQPEAFRLPLCTTK